MRKTLGLFLFCGMIGTSAHAGNLIITELPACVDKAASINGPNQLAESTLLFGSWSDKTCKIGVAACGAKRSATDTEFASFSIPNLGAAGTFHVQMSTEECMKTAAKLQSDFLAGKGNRLRVKFDSVEPGQILKPSQFSIDIVK